MSPQIFTSIINGYLPEPHASLLNGIIFGIPLSSSGQFYQQLKVVGLLHLVVLSGINITLLAAIISSLTGFLGKQISILITILMIILFVLFVGPQAPIVRAGIMGILTFVAVLYNRRTYAFYSLFLSLLIIFIFFRSWITTISLQLSYAATFGLIIFSGKKGNPVFDEIKTSLAAQVFTTPLIFLYFRQISLISPLANLFVSFLIAPLMIFGFITAIFGKIHLSLGIIPAYICYGLLSYIVFIVRILSKLPFAYFKF